MKRNKVLLLLLSNIFIAFLGIGLVIPVMPTLMREMGLSGTAMGNLVSAFAVAQLIVSPISGKWIDQFGRKKMITIGMFIFGLSELIFGLGKQLEILYFSRVLGGISAAFIMPAVTAYVADITTLVKRPKALGYLSAAINTGFIIGPGIGGFLADYGTRIPFYFAAALGFFSTLFSLIVLKEPKRSEETKVSIKKSNKSIWNKLLTPIYLFPLLILLTTSLGLATFESMYSLFVDHKFSFTPKDIAVLITVSSILGVVVQIFLFAKITSVIGEIRFVEICLVIGSVFTYLLIKCTSFWAVLAVTFCVYLAFDLIRPALTTYLSRLAGSDQGFVSGMDSTFTSIGNCIGPLVGGVLFDIELNYPYIFSAVLLTISFMISMLWDIRKKRTHDIFSPKY